MTSGGRIAWCPDLPITTRLFDYLTNPAKSPHHAALAMEARSRHGRRRIPGTRLEAGLDDLVLSTIQQHAASLLRTARAHSLCLDDAHDAYQRAIEIFLRRASTVDPATMTGWLRTVVKHEAMAVRASRMKLVGPEEVDLDLHEHADLKDADERAATLDLTARSAEALQRLKPHEVQALLLKAEGLSYADMQGTADPADDTTASFSSRGPSPGGRKKPDLVAVAKTEVANVFWGFEHIWRADTGTSFAAPQVAGAAALLFASGLTDPLLQKAVLLDSARPGRSTPSSAMGTQTAWQPDWGWGELNLAAAHDERQNVDADSVPGGSARFYRANVQSGDRATVVWNRRVTGCVGIGCSSTTNPMTLTNLQLEERNAQTEALRTASTSAIDNVEQVRAPSAGDVVYVVKAASTVEGLAAEPFAMAARRPLTRLAIPQPDLDVTTSLAQARPGQDVTVSATVRNPSADLAGRSAHVTLALPAGVELASGSGPADRDLGTLATSGTAPQQTWTVRGTADGLRHLNVTASAAAYGQQFTRSTSPSLRIDGTGPTTALTAPSGTRIVPTMTLPLSWRATDAGSGVASYDVEEGIDGGAFTRLRNATTGTQTTVTGTAGHRYRFRARARDVLGNAGPWATSAETKIIAPPPPADPHVQVTARAQRSRMTARITAARAATGLVEVRARARVHGRVVGTVRRAYIHNGRLSLRLPRNGALRRVHRIRFTATYSGDRSFRRAVATFTLRTT